MFISVDLPAPFSPSRACTSPRRRSKSTLSSATMPGKRFVIPRISRTAAASTRAILRRKAGPEARLSIPPLRPALEVGRDVQLARDDQALVLVHELQVWPCDRVGLPDGHAVVLQVEEEVGATLEVAELL